MNKVVTKLFGSQKVMKAKKIEYEFKTEEFSEDFFFSRNRFNWIFFRTYL